MTADPKPHFTVLVLTATGKIIRWYDKVDKVYTLRRHLYTDPNDANPNADARFAKHDEVTPDSNSQVIINEAEEIPE